MQDQQRLPHTDAGSHNLGHHRARTPRRPRSPRSAQLVSTVVIELPAARRPAFLSHPGTSSFAATASAREAGARVHFDGARIWDFHALVWDHTLSGRSPVTLPTALRSPFLTSRSVWLTARCARSPPLRRVPPLAATATAGILFQQWPTVRRRSPASTARWPRIPRIRKHARTSPRHSPPRSRPRACIPAAAHTPNQFRLLALPGPCRRRSRRALGLPRRKVWGSPPDGTHLRPGLRDDGDHRRRLRPRRTAETSPRLAERLLQPQPPL